MDKIRIPLVKNSLLALSLFGLVIYCSEDPEVGSAELIGKWQLSEVLFDPGDGSGEFQPVESHRFFVEWKGPVKRRSVLP